MRSQLTDANISNINSSNWVANYSYYKNGDMAYRTIQSNTGTFSYNGHQMTGATGGENFSLNWDENGNLKLKDMAINTALTYNWDNKLRHGQGSSTIDLKYDPSGNRIWKKITAGGPMSWSTSKYIVDIVGDLPTVLLELNPKSNMQIVKTYIYANGQIIAQHDGSYSTTRYFYLHDRLGSVREIIDTSGNVVEYYTYQPFGETIESGGILINPFKFSGQFFDDEIGQYYLRARQYDPYISRFTSRDPVFGKFEEPMTLHKYLYCLNNPINRTDPAGLWPTPVHNQIIDEEYSGLSQTLRNEIYAGSREADSWKYQNPAHAYMHAMTDATTGQSVEDAQKQMWGFVFDNLHCYNEYLNAGDQKSAYYYLGFAMHPIMDSTCPVHNWQSWGGTWHEGLVHKYYEPTEISRGDLDTTKLLMEQAMIFSEAHEFLNFAFGG